MRSKHTFNRNDKHVSQSLTWMTWERTCISGLAFDSTYNEIGVKWDIKLFIKKLGSVSNCEES